MKKRTEEILLNLNSRSYLNDISNNINLKNIRNKTNNCNPKYNISNFHNLKNNNKLKETGHQTIYENNKNKNKFGKLNYCDKRNNKKNEGIKNSNDNKENINFNKNITSFMNSSVCLKTNYQTNNKKNFIKVNNINPNAKTKNSYFEKKLNNKKTKDNKLKEEKIRKENFKDKLNLSSKNQLNSNRNDKKIKNQKLINRINFNEDLIINKHSSTINIFRNKKNDDLNNINKTILRFNSYKTARNNKEKEEIKNAYSINLNLENKTEYIKTDKLFRTTCDKEINSNYEINTKSLKNLKYKKPDLIIMSDNNKNRVLNKNIICFNKEENQSFSTRTKNKIIQRQDNGNVRTINNKNMNSKKIPNNKNLRNLIFNFERMDSQKVLTHNLSNISINKFVNEDGTKEDINYKMNKTKYISPKINSERNKIKHLFVSKNKKLEKEKESHQTKQNSNNIQTEQFEYNIKYTKLLLNNIKLESNKSKEFNTTNDKINNKINY